MSQLNIVTTPTNSGLGTPLANAFNYCNSNFSELYARYQVNPPVSLVGTIGDVAGMYATDSSFFYYCFANYNGYSTIWAQISQIGNVTVTTISSGNSNVSISNLNGNATVSIAGTSNVAVFSSTGQYVTGLVSATGNIAGDYILGNGSQLTGLPATYNNSNVTTLLSAFGSNTISTTGNITSGNLNTNRVNTGGQVSASGNVTGGNLLTGGRLSATGNIVTDQYFVGNFFGNVTGNFVVPGSNTQVIYNTSGNADASAGFTFDTAGPNLLTVLGTISSTGNVRAANILTSGQLSATGNITGNNLNATQIFGTLGTSAQNTITSVGTLSSLNVTANIQAGNLRTGGQISATGNIRGGNINITDVEAAGNISATRYTGTSISVAGNITGSYILGNGSQLTGLPATYSNSNVSSFLAAFGSNTISTTGTITAGNITGLSLSVTGDVSATGNAIVGNISVGAGTIIVGNIVSGTGNLSGDIGTSANWFGNAYVQAVNALYADLAENYIADANYAPGTVVIFGGEQEITVTTEAADERVAGVISTNPAYLMNSSDPGLPVALRGKVPVRVVGPVTKGDSLVTSTTPGVSFSVGRERVYGQAVFAKALESNNNDGEKVILAVII